MLKTIFCVLLLVGICCGQVPRSCGRKNQCVPQELCKDPSARLFSLNKMEVGRCHDKEVCCPIAKIIPESEASRGENSACGHRNVNGLAEMTATNARPSEPNEAEFGEFPWVVAILETRIVPGYIQSRFLCGGSLIHPRAVLTVAHHVTDKVPGNILSRAGEWEPHSDLEPFTHQDRKAKNIIIHDRYHTRARIFDAALVILEQPFDESPHIKPICLPDVDVASTGATCFVAGWGLKAFQSSQFPMRLKKIDLKVPSVKQCNDMLRRTHLGQYYAMHSSFICAGGEAGKDACTGDGGSALMCPFPGNEDKYYQAGIVLGGLRCGEADVPGIYTNVSNIRPWIDSVLAKLEVME